MHEQNREDPLSFTFYLKDQVVKNGEITGYKWVIDTVTVSTSETCTYSFSEYKDVKVTLFLNDSAGNITELRDDFSLTRPLKLVKTSSFPSLLKITDTS